MRRKVCRTGAPDSVSKVGFEGRHDWTKRWDLRALEFVRIDDLPRYQIDNPVFIPRRDLRFEAAYAAYHERHRRCLGLQAHRLDRIDEYAEELRSELAVQTLGSKETPDQVFVRHVFDGLCWRDVQ